MDESSEEQTETVVAAENQVVPAEQTSAPPLEMPTDVTLPTEVHTSSFAALPSEPDTDLAITPEVAVEQPIAPVDTTPAIVQEPVAPVAEVPVQTQQLPAVGTPVLPMQSLDQTPVAVAEQQNTVVEQQINIQPVAPAIDINAQVPGTINPPVALDSTPQTA